jgi:uncharacterized protein
MIIISIALLEKGDIELNGVMTPKEMNIADSPLIKFSGDISYQLSAKLINGSVLLDGEVSSSISSICGRCTRVVEQKLVNSTVCHFYEDIDQQTIDVTDDIREDLLIMLPVNPLCSEQCLGLCNKCGADLNHDDCGCVIEENIAADIWGDLDKLDFGD